MRRHEPNKPYVEYVLRYGFDSTTYMEGETQDVFRQRRNEALLGAAQRGDATSMQLLIDDGALVNQQDKQTGATSLHYAAAYHARAALRVLLKSGKCDFLIRDKAGRLASEMAGVYGNDPAVARLLRRKELAQARGQGIVLARRAPTRP
jgi:ankyrin repeat protein